MFKDGMGNWRREGEIYIDSSIWRQWDESWHSSDGTWQQDGESSPTPVEGCWTTAHIDTGFSDDK